MTPVQEIKERLDIVEFIKNYVQLTPAGKNYKARCPFHNEKTPSFIVSPERQTWHCFGSCGEGGDVFKFLMKHENLEFYEALTVLAEKAGIALKRLSPADQKQFGVLYDINTAAKDFFKQELNKIPNARTYLKKRGIRDAIMDEFEIGFAPQAFDRLVVHLTGLRYDIKDIERAGLAFKSERGSYIDKFRNRIMFPISDHMGKVVGFSGRIFEEGNRNNTEVAKYLNSPETPIFKKSRLLYGFDKTKQHIKQEKAALLVEGQMDLLAAYADGAKNVIATSGTALTQDHLKTLRRFTDTLIICFDADDAGMNAFERAHAMAAGTDFDVRALLLDGFKDPAEVVEKKPGLFAEMVRKAKPALEILFDRYFGKNGERKEQQEIRETKNYIKLLLGRIKHISSAVEQAHWLRQLANRTGIEERFLIEELNQLKMQNDEGYMQKNLEQPRTGYGIDAGSQRQSTSSQRESALSRRELIARRLVSLLAAREHLRDTVTESLDYMPDAYAAVAKKLIAGEAPGKEQDDIMNMLSLRASFDAQFIEESAFDEECSELRTQLKREYLKERLRALRTAILKAEQSQNNEQRDAILKEFAEISKILHTEETEVVTQRGG